MVWCVNDYSLLMSETKGVYECLIFEHTVNVDFCVVLVKEMGLRASWRTSRGEIAAPYRLILQYGKLRRII